jgi:Protein of unknown function (DUF1064)
MKLKIRNVVKHKFGAVKCQSDGIKFPSRLERDYYEQLKVRQKSGEVLFFLRQPVFDLPGKTKYLADFAVYLCDGTVEFIDTKGRDTPISILKRKQVEEIYPIEIKIVTRV